MKRILCVLTMLLAAACFADGAGMAPINPALKQWLRQRREMDVSSKTNAVKKRLLATADSETEFRLGHVPGTVDYSYLKDVNYSGLARLSRAALPSRFDLRDVNGVPAVKDQGSLGTCWAHATMGVLESSMLMQKAGSFDYSEKHLAMTHGWDYGIDDGGNGTIAMAYLVRWGGPIAETEDPYPSSKYNILPSPTGTPLGHVHHVKILPPMTAATDTETIKRCVLEEGAVYAGYIHAWNACSTDRKTYYFNGSAAVAYAEGYGGHAVQIVGWDDSFSRNNFRYTPAGDGAFLAKNSWGTSFGDKGYFWVSYYDYSFGKDELYVFGDLRSTDSYSTVYQYDPLGAVRWFGSGKKNVAAYGANMFVSTGAEQLSAVGIYSCMPSTKYVISIYTGCTAGKPTSGTLQCTKSGVADFCGFLTVPLDTEVTLTKGTIFSVVLKATSQDYGYPQAMEALFSWYEYDENGNQVQCWTPTSNATASRSQSFYSFNGTSWTDLTEYNSTANFCIKAYAKSGTTTKTLSAINCYSSDNSTTVASGKTKQFTCKATYSDGSEKEVTPTWSITSGGSYGSISSSGLFTAASVTSEQDVGVKASYTEGDITKTSSFTVTITVAAPNAPTGLTATAGTESSCVRLAWTAVDGATGYTIYRATGSGASSASAKSLGRVDQPKYADTDATPGVDYTYFVKAKNGSGTSGFSSGASGWRALAAPTDVAASDGTSTDYVKVGWSEVSGATVYRVYRGTTEANLTALSGWITDLAYTDTTATPGTLYYYAVKSALDAAGTRASEMSIPDTGVREKTNVPESMAISGPSTLASGAQGSYTANVRWSNGDSATCVPTWTCEGKSSTVSPFVYTAPVVSASKTVTLTAKATVEGVALTATQTITVSPSITAAPSAPTISATTTSGISLSWTSVSGASSYVVYRGTTTASSSATKIGTATGTTFTDTSVTPGQTVYYFLAAVNAAGTSALSAASSSAVRSLAAPTGVTASNGTYTDKVRVTWTAVVGASHYRVSRATSSTGSQTDLGSWQTGTTYDDTSATAGTAYYYFVRAATSSSGANVSAKSSPGAKGLRKVEVLPDTLEIIGPDRVNASATAQYAAKVTFTDKSTQTVTAGWSRSGTAATIDSTGKLTAASVTADATVTLTATYTASGKTVTGNKSVAIIAPIAKTVTVSNVKATSRWPWKSIIDIDYTLTVSPSDTKADISVEATDKDRQQTFPAQTLTGDTEDLAAGIHRVSWNIGTDKPDFATSQLDIDVKARVRAVPQPKSTYLVIDLSGGTDAANYPIEELDAVPSGGWSDEYKTSKLVLRRIEPGTFTMGSPSDEVGHEYGLVKKEDLHQVTLTKAYYMGVFEVTQRQWELVMGSNPSFFTNATCYAARPVEMVSYNMIRGSSSGADWPDSSSVDGDSFLGKIRQKTGLMTLDLPTEAEWENACRAGTTTALNSGENLASRDSSDANMNKVGRYWGNGSGSSVPYFDTSLGTAKVGSYAANAWGLFDMHGNAEEWCLDWCSSSLGTTAVSDPVGDTSGSGRIGRGGNYFHRSCFCRSAVRFLNGPSGRFYGAGFRLSLRGISLAAETVTVAFDANGGSTAVSSQTYAKNGKYTSLPAATRDGYVFAGWYTAASGGTKVTSETAVSASITKLYAQWKTNAECDYLVIDLSGGTNATKYAISYLADVPDGGWSDYYKTSKLVLRRIEPGTFTMGSPSDEVGRSSNEDQHQVTLTKAFYMGVFEVTQRQWELVMGSKPSSFSNASYYAARPVEQVSYNDIRGSSAGAGWPASSAVDATSFLGKLRAKTGLDDFDLPTEAQWEYACRAGTTTALNSGKNLTNTASDANMAEVGRYRYNGGSSWSSSGDTSVGTAKVGSYAPNAWGLYDMHGNVWEWCLDWYSSSLETTAVADPVGTSSGSDRLLRGGCWILDAHYCRSAIRGSNAPSTGGILRGLRLSLR